jgi:dihydroorotase-like cyclic amidohydrolase
VAADAYPSFSDYSPYAGRTYRGAITHTILRGTVVVDDGWLSPEPAAPGRYMHRAP